MSKARGFVPSPFLFLRRKAARAMIFTGPLAATGFAYERCCCCGTNGQPAIGGQRRPAVKGRPGSRILFDVALGPTITKAEKEPPVICTQGTNDDGKGYSDNTAGPQSELPGNAFLEQPGIVIGCCMLMVRKRVLSTMSRKLLRSSTTTCTSGLD